MAIHTMNELNIWAWLTAASALCLMLVLASYAGACTLPIARPCTCLHMCPRLSMSAGAASGSCLVEVDIPEVQALGEIADHLLKQIAPLLV